MTISIYDERLTATNGYKPCAVVTWTFTTDASGDVTEETSATLNGQVSRIVTNPDNTDTPTTLWDFTLKDEDGIDILCGDGADRDAADSGASEQVSPCPPCPGLNSKLTFTVANGGNAKKGVVKGYYT
jgi:hypothetical protein